MNQIKISFTFILGLLFISVFLQTGILIKDVGDNGEENQVIIKDIEDTIKTPSVSWFNNSADPIEIDATATGVDAHNWTWARSQEWCREGDGSLGSPYLIENISIDCMNSGNGIYIKNSNNIYFTIRNCTIIKAQPDPSYGGIRLENTSNGTIINNNCSNNGEIGIILALNSDFNNIINNIASNVGTTDQNRGIALFTNCDFNNISYNTVKKNVFNGIYIDSNSNFNYISHNIVDDNNDGIDLHMVTNNTVYNNTVYDNDRYGVYLQTASCTGNIVYCNRFFNNLVNNGVDQGTNHWDNGTIGNYWGNYSGVDADDDGIGDTAHIFPDGQDNYPIWDDGDDSRPTITIISPVNYTEFTDPPTVLLSFYDYYSVNATWYKYIGFSGNISLIGNMLIVNQTIWNQIGEGTTLTIRFFANDSSSHLTYKDLIIRKYNPSVSSDDDDDDEVAIPGYNLILIIGSIFLVSAVISLVMLKKRAKH